MKLNTHSHGTRLAIGVTAAVLGFMVAGGGAAIATGALNGRVVIHPTLLAPNATGSSSAIPARKFPVNAHGQTYGSDLYSNSSATDPDLVQVIATNGQTGYVYSSQMNLPAPSSPAAALAQAAANTSGIFVPVYEQDGTTVIGQFEIAEPGNASG